MVTEASAGVWALCKPREFTALITLLYCAVMNERADMNEHVSRIKERLRTPNKCIGRLPVYFLVQKYTSVLKSGFELCNARVLQGKEDNFAR